MAMTVRGMMRRAGERRGGCSSGPALPCHSRPQTTPRHSTSPSYPSPPPSTFHLPAHSHPSTVIQD
eukprot:1022513-Rhodomonas_salina.1